MIPIESYGAYLGMNLDFNNKSDQPKISHIEWKIHNFGYKLVRRFQWDNYWLQKFTRYLPDSLVSLPYPSKLLHHIVLKTIGSQILLSATLDKMPVLNL